MPDAKFTLQMDFLCGMASVCDSSHKTFIYVRRRFHLLNHTTCNFLIHSFALKFPMLRLPPSNYIRILNL